MKTFYLQKFWSGKEQKLCDYIEIAEDNIILGCLSNKGKMVKNRINLRSKRNAIRILKQNFKVKKRHNTFKWMIQTFDEVV